MSKLNNERVLRQLEVDHDDKDILVTYKHDKNSAKIIQGTVASVKPLQVRDLPTKQR